ncbi:arrestin domain-containing protein 4-like isoform X2 [Genypterus blacodes]|uniref:arrestin domain-containing protein 4-like isoform X2 n=1 Tax=Genypterus blacodes TaxID=154954 RepID=UPI003F7591F4
MVLKLLVKEDTCFLFPSRSLIGKIIHKVKAELKQSMKLTKKAETHFTFVSKADMNIPGLMEPQYGCKDKSVTFFGSGNISMDIHTKQMGYKQGETLQITAEISNRSTRSVKPKFVLYEKQSFFAQGHRKLYTREIIKEKIEPIESSGTQTVTKTITIPKGLPASILNCPIIKLEYRLRVYLDVKCASDPEVKLPIVILPASGIPATAQPYGYAAFSPNPPAWGPAPPQPAAYPLVGPAPPQPAAYPLVGPAPPQPAAYPLVGPAPPQPAAYPLVDPAPPQPAAYPLVDPAPPQPAAYPLVDPAPPQPAAYPLVDPAPPQPAAYPLVGPPPPYGAYGPNPSLYPDLSYGIDKKY